jgi:hypothetical protein
VANGRLDTTRTLAIVGQDPSVRGADGRILKAELTLPAEALQPGPRGHRVHVLDFDTSTKNRLYRPLRLGKNDDVIAGASDSRILRDPGLHAQNVYAITMGVLSLFEAALGRRVAWGFEDRGHQLKIVPHAFAQANAYYSRRDEALLFGYFPSRRRRREMVFTCLSHDVVAHETTHALLDGLRSRYAEPSSLDQAAFHEGFSDVVALLSVFRLPEVVERALRRQGKGRGGSLPRSSLTREKLRASAIFYLAEQMGSGLGLDAAGDALRMPGRRNPDHVRRNRDAYETEPHLWGEVFVAAMIHALVEVWAARIEELRGDSSRVSLRIVADEGTKAAKHLLAMAIRALDYCPPVDLQFGDFLSAVLTSDREIFPEDQPYGYRRILREAFGSFDLAPATRGEGCWEPPEVRLTRKLSYRNCHFATMQYDPDEMFRFISENRDALELDPEAYTYVASVRPCHRIGPDGIVLRETVAEYVQILDLEARELRRLGVHAPDGMPDGQKVRLWGGGALLFDEFGQLKFHVGSGIRSADKQNRRLDYLWRNGGLRGARGAAARRFALLHLRRALALPRNLEEAW